MNRNNYRPPNRSPEAENPISRYIFGFPETKTLQVRKTLPSREDNQVIEIRPCGGAGIFPLFPIPRGYTITSNDRVLPNQ